MQKIASIYAKSKGKTTTARILIRDGSNHDKTAISRGVPKRDRYIQQVVCIYQSQIVFRVQLSHQMPHDPSFEFQFNGGKQGDRVDLAWQDSQGEIKSVSSVIL